MSDHRANVVVTGVGFVTPIGDHPRRVWSRLSSGATGIRPLGCYPTGQGGAVIDDFDPAAEVSPKRILKMINRPTTFALGAARRAWEDAGLEPGTIPPERFGVYVGSGESEMRPEAFFPGVAAALGPDGQLDLRRFATEGLEAVDPYLALTSLSNNALCYVSIAHNLRGPNNNYVKSGVASSQAVGEAMLAIRHGYADAVMVVGVDCLTDPLAVTSYNSVGLLSAARTNVEQAMRPFDTRRDGFQPGEGAAALVLESERTAQARNARVYGRVLGFGQATDLGSIIAPPLDGGQLPGAIETALEDAQLAPDALDFVIAHGNASVRGDLSEANGLAAAVGGALRTTPTTATKPISGHLGAASGALETAFALLMLQHGCVPPIRNLAQPDAACPLNFVMGSAIQVRGRAALHVARGIGGQNAALVVAGVEP